MLSGAKIYFGPDKLITVPPNDSIKEDTSLVRGSDPSPLRGDGPARSDDSSSGDRFETVTGNPPASSSSHEKILGLSPADYIKALSVYQEELRSRGTAGMLNRANTLGAIPDEDPIWLTFSPFGLHLREFLGLLKNSEIGAYFASSHPLRVASYGAGLHDDADYVRYRYDDTELGAFTDSIKSQLRSFQRKLFGPTERCSYEPRELLLLFLAGNRDGTIVVFDNHPLLAEELRRPTLPLIELFGFYYETEEIVRGILDYYHFLTQKRSVDIGSEYIPPLGDIHYLNSYLTDQEMAKINYRAVDIATDSLAEREGFHFSVWIESDYFFPEPLRQIVLAKIVRAMKPGSYLLTNPIRIKREKLVRTADLISLAKLFGLELIGLASNHQDRHGTAALYRRVSNQHTAVVKGLTEIQTVAGGGTSSSTPQSGTPSVPSTPSPATPAPSGSTAQSMGFGVRAPWLGAQVMLRGAKVARPPAGITFKPLAVAPLIKGL